MTETMIDPMRGKEVIFFLAEREFQDNHEEEGK
jgi:hypothetical protein